jgi:cyclic pyranopterin phosphate synthase
LVVRDVSSKYNTLRSAAARGTVSVSEATAKAILAGNVPKADPFGVAKVAGIQAAKNTSQLIPYCHQVPLDFVGVDIALEGTSIVITSRVIAVWKTGVEMEALAAVAGAALTLYDMLKIIDDGMEIAGIRLLEKRGGKSEMKASGEGYTAGVLVLSDSVSAGKAEDSSGAYLREQLSGLGFAVKAFKVLADERAAVERELLDLSDRQGIDLVVTTGGTGIGPRDVTPEATQAVIERRLEGVEEAVRKFGQDRLPMAMLSRAVAGVRGKTVIINLPGSRGAVADGMTVLFPAIMHAFRMIKGGRH